MNTSCTRTVRRLNKHCHTCILSRKNNEYLRPTSPTYCHYSTTKREAIEVLSAIGEGGGLLEVSQPHRFGGSVFYPATGHSCFLQLAQFEVRDAEVGILFSLVQSVHRLARVESEQSCVAFVRPEEYSALRVRQSSGDRLPRKHERQVRKYKNGNIHQRI